MFCVLSSSALPGFLRLLGGDQDASSKSVSLEPSFKRMMIYLFIGTRGGHNRVRIVELLKNYPSNPNKIAEKLALDYKTVQHHLKLLEEHGVVVSSSKDSYGAVYFLTPYFDRFYGVLKEMWAKFGQS
jgi:DNA-binding transcriptional ArsR family regulator